MTEITYDGGWRGPLEVNPVQRHGQGESTASLDNLCATPPEEKLFPVFHFVPITSGLVTSHH